MSVNRVCLSFLIFFKGIVLFMPIFCVWMIGSQACLAQIAMPPPKPPVLQTPPSTSDTDTAAKAFQDAFNIDTLFQAVSPVTEQYLKSIDGTSQEFSVTVPLIVDRKRGRIFVEPQINERKIRFILDTGGSSSIVLDKARAKGIALDHTFLFHLHGVQGYEPATVGIAHSMTLGLLTLNSIVTVIRSSASQNSLSTIGTQLFHSYRVLLDFTANTMTVSRGGLPAKVPKGEAVLTLPFREENGHIFIPVRVLNQSTWAALDSGCDVNILSLDTAQKAAMQLAPNETISRVTNGAIGYGNTAKSMLIVLAKPVPIFIDTDRIGATDFSTTSQVGSSILGEINQNFQTHIDVNLGAPFFLQFRRVIIDYPNHMLTLQGTKHGAPVNMASSPAPGKPWPNYIWQRVGDGWVEVPEQSAASVPAAPAIPPLPVTPTQTVMTNTSFGQSVTTISNSASSTVTVIVNGMKSEYPLGTTVTVYSNGKVQINPPQGNASVGEPK